MVEKVLKKKYLSNEIIWQRVASDYYRTSLPRVASLVSFVGLSVTVGPLPTAHFRLNTFLSAVFIFNLNTYSKVYFGLIKYCI